MTEPNTYYEKILVSSSKLPNDGSYTGYYKGNEPCVVTIKNRMVTYIVFEVDRGSIGLPDKYFKEQLEILVKVSIPSPKQEAVDNDITLQDFEVYFKVDKFLKSIIENCKSELYDKFKEKGEK